MAAEAAIALFHQDRERLVAAMRHSKSAKLLDEQTFQALIDMLMEDAHKRGQNKAKRR